MELYKEKLSELNNIPVLNAKALNYVFEKDMVPKNGMWMEFGTYDGRSINKIALYKEDTIYGFDSFEGLPEDWEGRGIPKGAFDLGGSSVYFNTNTFFTFPNVKLVKGWFCDSLPKFMEENDKPISFIHMDCDIYSSTVDVFKNVATNIVDGCVIVFDELLGYNNFEEHEWKAWWEFVEKHKIEFEWIGCNLNGVDIQSNASPLFGEGAPSFHLPASPSCENAAVRIIKNPSCKF